MPTPDRFVDDTFSEPTSNWPVRDTGTASAEYTNGRYRLTVTGQTSTGVSTVLPARNYRLSVDVTVTQGSAGIVFLSAAPTAFYHFLIDTEGSYAIQKVQQNMNNATTVVDWTKHAALQNGNDAVNRLRIERQGSTITFFANDQLLNTFELPVGELTNQYGFALTSEARQGEATFDNLVVERLPIS